MHLKLPDTTGAPLRGRIKHLQVAESISSSQQAYDQRQPVFVVAGSKNLGKSTFARLLVNRLLNSHKQVAYMDTDLGQPELTVPGDFVLYTIQLM